MNEKKILIFGGSGSIGKALAIKLKKNDYSPVIISRNENELKNISKEINCEYRVCDVLNSNKIKEISDEYKDLIFGVAYCVGSINLKPLKITKDEDFIDSFKINTLGAINVIKFNQESLTKNNGSILLYSTIAVKQGFTNHTIISTSKGAIEGLTVSLAAELSPNVRVNCLAPSLTESGMSKSIIANENVKKAIETLHPIPKIGIPEDHSKLAAFLIGESNTWITGQVFNIDGGRSTIRKKG